jgi:integrase
VPNLEFSDAKLRSLPAPPNGQVDYWCDKLSGFGCRVSQAGSKTFVLKYQNRRITIGRFGILTLAEARTEAKRLLAEFTLGKTQPKRITFESAKELFLEEKKKKCRAKTIEEYTWLLGLLNFPGQLSEITFEEAERQIKKQKKQSVYDHLLVISRIFFTWCIKRRYLAHSPVTGLSTYGTKKTSRPLTNDDVRAIWRALCDETNELHPSYRAIVKLLILCGQRRGETSALCGAFYSHNQQTVTFPADLTKNHKESCIPLGSLALTIINGRASEPGLWFPGKTPERRFNGWSKCKRQLDQASGVTGWKLHSLRKYYRSTLAKLKVPSHIGERLLNHVSAVATDVELIYDQYSYLDEMRAAVENYEKFLQSILAP